MASLITTSIGANVVSTLIGRQIMTHAISDASGSIYNSIGDIFYYSNSIDKFLTELDIENRIKNMQLIITKFEDIKEDDSINQCLEGIHDMIIRIREDLKQINIKIEKHKNKYINKWRSLNIKDQMYNLKIHSLLLDKRYDFLVKTVNLSSCLLSSQKS
jgi:hypothetical protein